MQEPSLRTTNSSVRGSLVNIFFKKPKEEDLEEIIFTKLQSLKKEIREKNSSKSIFRNKHFESVESSSAESNTNSPPKLSPIQNRRSLNSSALKPKPQDSFQL